MSIQNEENEENEENFWFRLTDSLERLSDSPFRRFTYVRAESVSASFVSALDKVIMKVIVGKNVQTGGFFKSPVVN